MQPKKKLGKNPVRMREGGGGRAEAMATNGSSASLLSVSLQHLRHVTSDAKQFPPPTCRPPRNEQEKKNVASAKVKLLYRVLPGFTVDWVTRAGTGFLPSWTSRSSPDVVDRVRRRVSHCRGISPKARRQRRRK